MALHGKTAENGKSQVLELARGLLPDSAICSVPASKMGDERHVIGPVGKLLKASDELSAEAIATDTFKAVVGPVAFLCRSRCSFKPCLPSGPVGHLI